MWRCALRRVELPHERREACRQGRRCAGCAARILTMRSRAVGRVASCSVTGSTTRTSAPKAGVRSAAVVDLRLGTRAPVRAPAREPAALSDYWLFGLPRGRRPCSAKSRASSQLRPRRTTRSTPAGGTAARDVPLGTTAAASAGDLVASSNTLNSPRGSCCSARHARRAVVQTRLRALFTRRAVLDDGRIALGGRARRHRDRDVRGERCSCTARDGSRRGSTGSATTRPSCSPRSGPPGFRGVIHTDLFRAAPGGVNVSKQLERAAKKLKERDL